MHYTTKDLLAFADDQPVSHAELRNVLSRVGALLRTRVEARFVYIRVQDQSGDRLPLGAMPVEVSLGEDERGMRQGRALHEQLVSVANDQNAKAAALVSKAFSGPAQIAGSVIEADRALILHYHILAEYETTIVLDCTRASSLPNQRTETQQFLQLALGPLLERFRGRSRNESHKRRRVFYSKLLATAPDRPSLDHKHLCRVWKELFNASSVWLWIHNSTNGQWELLATSPMDEGLAKLNFLAAPERTCVAEYCNLTETSEHVDDFATWTRSYRGETFSVACKPLFDSMGYKALDCVPLPFPEILIDAKETAPRVPLRAAVCAHYREPDSRYGQPDDSVRLMAKISAVWLINSYQSEQREILYHLNRIGHEFLSTKSKNPHLVRHQYLMHLISLIQSRLNVKWVSVFYRNETNTKVVCLATTGLWGKDGKKLDEDGFREASYELGRHRTGGVFLDGRVCIQRLGANADKKSDALFRETDPQLVDESKVAWVIMPIPSPRTDSAPPGRPHCIGVIRCTGNQAHSWQDGTERNFDPVQLQTLGFFAREIGPALETMAAQVQREMAVNYIKHDLYAPVEMISECIEEIAEAQVGASWTGAPDDDGGGAGTPGRELRPYLLHDLRRSLMFLEELVHRLDPDPTIVDRIFPQKTYLDRQILARLKAMLYNYAMRLNRMTVEFSHFEELPALNVDRFLVERVFTNLIGNAIKYGQAGTKIIVEARRESDGFHVAVSNFGAGVLRGEEEAIFREQFRSAWARQNRMGAGLGLKISRTIMEMHRGRLELVSARNPTTFEMIFPRDLEIGEVN